MWHKRKKIGINAHFKKCEHPIPSNTVLLAKLLQKNLISVKLPPLLPGTEVDVPHDGNCLLWSACLARLLENKEQFSEIYFNLFGSDTLILPGSKQVIEIGRIETMNHFKKLLDQSISSLTTDPLAKILICVVFRQRIIESAPKYFDQKQLEAVAASTEHPNWSSYEKMAKKSGSFGGDFEISLITRFLGCNINMISNGFSYKFNTNPPSQKTITLLHVNAENKSSPLNHFRFICNPGEIKSNTTAKTRVKRKKNNDDQIWSKRTRPEMTSDKKSEYQHLS